MVERKQLAQTDIRSHDRQEGKRVRNSKDEDAYRDYAADTLREEQKPC